MTTYDEKFEIFMIVYKRQSNTHYTFIFMGYRHYKEL